MFNKSFDMDEFMTITQKYNQNAFIKEVELECSHRSFFDKMKKSVEKDRRGEIVFCVVRPDGEIITITCEEYPEGVFRIPTGGINYGENITEGVHREVMEELGLVSEISNFAGALKIKIMFNDEYVFFYSYIFIMLEVSGNLLIDATDKEVSEVKTVRLSELKHVADKLLNIGGVWHDWGQFRYITTRAVYDFLAGNI
jgi:8-oxo-dGTP diphosphatase